MSEIWLPACKEISEEGGKGNMIVGGLIAMLFILGLFLSMISSSPRPDDEGQADTAAVTK